MKTSFLGGRDFSLRVKEDLKAMFEERRPLPSQKNLLERTLYNIGDAAKKAKTDLSVPAVEEAYATIRLLDASEEEDDVMTLTYTSERLNEVCEDVFRVFRSFFREFLESV